MPRVYHSPRMNLPLLSLLTLMTVAAATAVSQAFGRFTYAVLLTDVRDEFGISNTLAGTFGSANLAAYLLASLAVSLMLARVGVVQLSRLSVITVALGLCLLTLAPSSTWVAAGLVLTGLGAAGVWITAPALAAAALEVHQRGIAIGVAISGVGIGIAVASLLDMVVDWRSVYLIEALVGAAVVLALFLLPIPSPVTNSPALGLRAIRLVPGWQWLLTAYGAFGLGMSIVVTFLVALLEDDAGLSARNASFAFALLGFGSVFGGPATGYLADRCGRRVALLAAYGCMTGTIVLLAWGDASVSGVGAFAFGIAFNAVPVAVTTVVADHARGAAFGAAYGLTTVVFGIGLTIGPQLGGILADATGSFRPGFWFAAAVAASGLAAAAVVGDRVTRAASARP